MRIKGAVLIPGKKMLRYHVEIGFYQAMFDPETIVKIKERVGNEISISKNHSDNNYSSATIVDSYILTSKNKTAKELDLPQGTWMIEIEFKNKDEYQFALANSTGFSFQSQFKFKASNGKEYLVKEGFRKMNQLSELLNVDLYIQGGGTSSTGRSEHGHAHFEVKERNSKKKLGDIFLPTLEQWRSLDDRQKLRFIALSNPKGTISKRERKAIVHWLDIDNESNLISSIQEWNKVNKDNHRAFQMPIEIKV